MDKDYREVKVTIILRDETAVDYKEFSDKDIVDEFKLFYNVNRADFTIVPEDSDGE